MKLAVRFCSLLVLASVALFYISCDNGDSPGKSDRDAQIEKLNGTWKITTNDNVTLDGGATGEDYTNFTLTLNGQQGNNAIPYTASNVPETSVWSSAGTLTFGTNVLQDLTREDGVSITYSVNETTLVMQFNYAGDPLGRVRNVEGDWRFTFARQ